MAELYRVCGPQSIPVDVQSASIVSWIAKDRQYGIDNMAEGRGFAGQLDARSQHPRSRSSQYVTMVLNVEILIQGQNI
jgi:hypothetical protein